MLAVAKDVVALVREILIIVAILLILIFPSQAGEWLWERGVKKVEFGGATVDLGQFDSTRSALNAVNAAANAPDTPPQLQNSLSKAAGELSQSLASQVRSIAQTNPNVLPQDGWMYLGTLNRDRNAWRVGVTPTVQHAWPLKVDDVVTLATDTNLHEDSTSEDRPQSRIISVLPSGTKVRIYDLDIARPVPQNDKAAPGYRAWAKVRSVG